MNRTLNLQTPASRWLAFVVFCVAFAPLSGATQAMLSLHGIRFYELMLIIFVAISPSLLLAHKLHALIFVCLIVFIGLIAHSIILGQSSFNTFNSLRDILWYFLGILLGRSMSGEVDHKKIVRYFAGLMSIYYIYLLLGYTVMKGIFLGFQEKALLGENNNEMMRIGFFSLPLILWHYAYLSVYAGWKKQRILFVVAAICCGIAIFFSSSRTFIGIYILISLMAVRVRLASLLFISIVAGAIVQLTVFLGSNRLSLDSMFASWVARNLPFIDAISNMSLVEVLFGKGIGQTVYIPWFEMAGFNPEARNLDGLFQTLLIKIGIVGVAGLVAWHLWIVFKLRKYPGVLARTLSIIVVAELLIGLTNSYLFQPSAAFYGLPLGMALAVLNNSLKDITSK